MKTGNLIKKVIRALLDSYKAFRVTSEPSLYMTLLVKNEEDILEQNLCFHKAMGVDGFIITDNNSTDHTHDIIEKFKAKGWIKEVIYETATNYCQKEWVDRMILLARKKYHADWVINADADELWYTPLGNLKEEMKQTHSNVLKCKVVSVYPDETKPFTQWDVMIKSVPNQSHYNLSLYSIFERQNHKVAHRTTSYIQIAQGNHKVTMIPSWASECGICVYHYNIRSKHHFMAKMVNGGKQYEQHPSKKRGRHWRYFYQLYKEGLLEQEYDKVIGRAVYSQLEREGFLYRDTTIADFFKRMD